MFDFYEYFFKYRNDGITLFIIKEYLKKKICFLKTFHDDFTARICS